MTLTRRRFLGTTALAATATTLVSTLPSPAVLGAERTKKYRTALVGCGWWGKNILNCAMASKAIEPVALVDVDTRQAATATKRTKEAMGLEPPVFKDYREMLEKVKPEIVINATPDHWHALITIAAVNSGAHVYVEKPVGHTINEGKAMVKATRATDRVVQVGTHRRTAPHHISAMEFIKSGKLGKIAHIKAFVNYPWGKGKWVDDAPVPEGLDWDFWCGPSKMVPFNPKMHPGGYRHFLEFSNGQISDWGTHWLDQILWWAGDKVMPKSVSAIGGRYIAEDNCDIPDQLHVQYQFDDFTVVWEHRHFAGNPQEHTNVGLYFFGENGVLHLGWLDGWSFYPKGQMEVKATEHVDSKLDLPDHQNIANLWADFLDAIENKRRALCDIELGHRATTMALLGMLSWKLGRGVTWDAANETIPNDAEAVKLLSREYRGPWKYPV